MNPSHPRLLVATEFAPRGPGGGLVLLRQMLQGWPAERLFWWSCRDSALAGEAQAVARHFVAPNPARLYPNVRFAGVRARLMELLWVPRAALHLRRTIEECRPDVVWVIPQNWSIPPLAKVMPRSGVPYHVSLHDYPDLASVVKRIGAGAACRLASGADTLYREAASRDAICPPMRDDLRRRTGADGLVNRVGVEAEDLAGLAAKHSQPASEISIAFAGTIIAEDAFEFFIRALGGIRSRLGRPLRVEFFGAHSHQGRAWFDASWMRTRVNLPEAEFRTALRGCAWGMAPTALAGGDPRYHRFSFPAKITSYLGAGLPLLSLAHPESSLMELAGRYGIGLCSATTRLETLQQELLATLAEVDPWARYGAEIRRCVSAEFSAGQMRAALHECFSAAAARRGGRG